MLILTFYRQIECVMVMKISVWIPVLRSHLQFWSNFSMSLRFLCWKQRQITKIIKGIIKWKGFLHHIWNSVITKSMELCKYGRYNREIVITVNIYLCSKARYNCYNDRYNRVWLYSRLLNWRHKPLVDPLRAWEFVHDLPAVDFLLPLPTVQTSLCSFLVCRMTYCFGRANTDLEPKVSFFEYSQGRIKVLEGPRYFLIFTE